MKFKCSQSKLLSAVINTAKASSSKSTIPALEGILFSLTGDVLTLTGYDLDMGIRTTIPVIGEEDGNIVINARLISDIIRKMPASDLQITVSDDFKVILASSEVKFSILGISEGDYPVVPRVNEEKSFELSQSILKNMIAQTLYAVAVTDLKPVHMGSKFDIIDNVLNVVSVDGVRMALRKEPVQYEDISFVVPGKTLNEISRLLEDDSEKKTIICVDKNQISFEINEYTIISRLLEGEFINYNNAMSFESDNFALVGVKEFADSLERALLLISERHKSAVKLVFEDDTLSVSCSTAIGKIDDKIKITYNGNPLTIGINAKYLLDAIKHSESDMVKIMLAGSLSPMKILPKDGESFIFLVLPVRMKGE